MGGRGLTGLVAIVAGAIGAAGSWMRFGKRRALRRTREEKYRGLKANLEVQRARAEAATEMRDNALHRAQLLGLPEDPRTLREMEASVADGEERAEALERWSSRDAELKGALQEAEGRLRDLFASRGVHVTNDLEAALGEYQDACTDRAETARKAARRNDLKAQIGDRERLEEQVQQECARQEDAQEELFRVARSCGVDGEDPEKAAESLRGWQSSQKRMLSAYQERERDWAELQALLEGRTLEQLEQELDEVTASVSADPETGPLSLPVGEPIDDVIQRLRAEFREASQKADTAAGGLTERAKRVPSVSGAEEKVEAARAELERVEALDTTLSRTLEFLEAAQERAHRSIAPRLNAFVEPHLSKITGGRYRDVTVDPDTLEVTVRAISGHFRAASRLSHGTRQQIYLLLRVAVAEHITRPDETCPLILDEVTVHSDSDRTRLLLETLRAIADTNQVVLFTQEHEVLAWAEENLTDERHSVVQLPQLFEESGSSPLSTDVGREVRALEDPSPPRPPTVVPTPVEEAATEAFEHDRRSDEDEPDPGVPSSRSPSATSAPAAVVSRVGDQYVIDVAEQRVRGNPRLLGQILESIVAFQRDFFERGLRHLKPDTQQRVAEDIGVDMSTVSRFVPGVWVRTPLGVHPVEFFFSSGVPTVGGSEVSSHAVRDAIGRLIEEEDPRKPLTDEKIAKRLEADGILIARRTVAKYREQLDIDSARRRRVQSAENGHAGPE